MAAYGPAWYGYWPAAALTLQLLASTYGCISLRATVSGYAHASCVLQYSLNMRLDPVRSVDLQY
eukprot:2065498-Rhodomonas_salina.3